MRYHYNWKNDEGIGWNSFLRSNYCYRISSRIILLFLFLNKAFLIEGVCIIDSTWCHTHISICVIEYLYWFYYYLEYFIDAQMHNAWWEIYQRQFLLIISTQNQRSCFTFAINFFFVTTILKINARCIPDSYIF